MTDCQACEELKINSPEFVLYGIREAECQSLRNNTGINPDLAVLHRNCEDLKTMNDCLLGYLGEELSKADICDLKEFVGDFLTNQKLMNQAFLCSDCGQWDQIDALWIEVKKLWAENEKVMNEINKLWSQNTQVTTAVTKIIQKLEEINVWQGGITGGFVSGKGIAGGNINLFAGTPDGNSYIRTNKNATENDLAGGISTAVLKQLKAELKEELIEELKEGE